MDKQAISFVMGNRLKELREERGLSHDKLIKQLNERYGISVSRDSVMAYEISDKFRAKASKLPNMGMRVETLYCLADFYGVSLDYLLGKTDVRTPDCTVQSICNYTGLSPDAVQVLHEFYYKQNPCPILFVVNAILHCEQVLRFNKLAWKGALAECIRRKIIEKGRNEVESSFPGLTLEEYYNTDKYKDILMRQNERSAETDRKLFDEAKKPIEETSRTIEVDVYVASSLYKERAIEEITRAADSAYQNYADEIMKILLGEEYEKIVKRRKKGFTEPKKK